MLVIGLLLVLPQPVRAETIRLPRTVPSFNQNFTDGPGAWGDCSLGTNGCPDRVSATGCLIAAFASVLGYYGVEVQVPAAASCTGRARSGMDPGLLNDWLRTHGGFGRCSQDPVGDCCLAWDRLPGDIELAFHSNRSDDGLNAVASVVIDHALREGHPIVAGVHWGAVCRGGSSQTEDCHWIVMTGKLGDTYTIVDPINPDASDPHGVRTTLDAGTHGNYIVDRFVVVSGTAGVSGPAITDLRETSEPHAPSETSAVTTVAVLIGLLAAVAAIIALVASKGE